MSDELFVDASAPFVFSDDAPLAFFNRRGRRRGCTEAGGPDRDGRRPLPVCPHPQPEAEQGPRAASSWLPRRHAATQINIAPLVARPRYETVVDRGDQSEQPFVRRG